MSKNPNGRPTKYRPEYCEMLIEHMTKGLSFESFAAEIDVSLQTIYDWTRAHEEFLEAKNRAFEKCRLFWEKLALLGASGLKSGNIDGRNINPTLVIWNMKCRFPKEWRDNKHVTFETNDINSMDKKQLIEETKRTIEFLEAEYEEESKDAQKALPPAKK